MKDSGNFEERQWEFREKGEIFTLTLIFFF